MGLLIHDQAHQGSIEDRTTRQRGRAVGVQQRSAGLSASMCNRSIEFRVVSVPSAPWESARGSAGPGIIRRSKLFSVIQRTSCPGSTYIPSGARPTVTSRRPTIGSTFSKAERTEIRNETSGYILPWTRSGGDPSPRIICSTRDGGTTVAARPCGSSRRCCRAQRRGGQRFKRRAAVVSPDQSGERALAK